MSCLESVLPLVAVLEIEVNVGLCFGMTIESEDVFVIKLFHQKGFILERFYVKVLCLAPQCATVDLG